MPQAATGQMSGNEISRPVFVSALRSSAIARQDGASLCAYCAASVTGIAKIFCTQELFSVYLLPVKIISIIKPLHLPFKYMKRCVTVIPWLHLCFMQVEEVLRANRSTCIVAYDVQNDDCPPPAPLTFTMQNAYDKKFHP